MAQPLSLIKFTAVLSLATLAAGCQPTYVADTAEQWSRWLRVNDQYAIVRWHHRTLAHQSRFCLAAPAMPAVDRSAVMALVGDALVEQFDEVGIVTEPVGADLARDSLACQGAHYLAYAVVEAVDCASEPQIDEQRPAACVGPGFSSMQLALRISDVHTGQTIDHIQIAARRAWTHLGSKELGELMAEPLARAVAALAGESDA